MSRVDIATEARNNLHVQSTLSPLKKPISGETLSKFTHDESAALSRNRASAYERRRTVSATPESDADSGEAKRDM